MSSQEIQRFLQAITQDHSLAVSIKTLCDHSQIVGFASRQGFDFSLSEWVRCAIMDQLQLQDFELERIYTTDCHHWSWAFRQVSAWRGLLMEGADINSAINSHPTVTQTHDSVQVTTHHENSQNSSMDLLLENFIALARKDLSLQDQIKAAKNESEILEVIKACGFSIDSMTLLRRWSKHTDFSRPTWMGWFD